MIRRLATRATIYKGIKSFFIKKIFGAQISVDDE
jgi:hypothetical protein